MRKSVDFKLDKSSNELSSTNRQTANINLLKKCFSKNSQKTDLKADKKILLKSKNRSNSKFERTCFSPRSILQKCVDQKSTSQPKNSFRISKWDFMKDFNFCSTKAIKLDEKSFVKNCNENSQSGLNKQINFKTIAKKAISLEGVFNQLLMTDFEKIQNNYFRLFEFMQTEIVTKEEYWNKKNCLLYFFSEKMIEVDLNYTKKICEVYGRRRVKICEANSFRFNEDSILKIKKYLNFYCIWKIAIIKKKFNTFFEESLTFPLDLFLCASKTDKRTIVMRLQTKTFADCRNGLNRQVWFFKMMRLMFLKESLLENFFKNYSYDLRHFSEEIRRTDESNKHHLEYLKERLKFYILQVKFDLPKCFVLLEKATIDTISTNFLKYVHSRLDYKLLNIKFAYLFYEIYSKLGQKEKGVAIFMKAIIQNLPSIQIYFEFLIKYKKIHGNLIQLSDGFNGKFTQKDAFEEKDKFVGQNNKNTQTNVSTYFEVIEEMIDFRRRFKYIKIVFERLGAIIDVEQLYSMISAIAKDCINLRRFNDAEVLYSFLMHFSYSFHLFDLFEMNQKSQSVSDYQEKNLALLQFNNQVFELYNSFLLISIFLEKSSQALVYIIACHFLYKNSVRLIESCDPVRFPKHSNRAADSEKMDNKIKTQKKDSRFADIFDQFNKKYQTTLELQDKFIAQIQVSANKSEKWLFKKSQSVLPSIQNLVVFDDKQFLLILQVLNIKPKISFDSGMDDEIRFPAFVGFADKKHYQEYINMKIRHFNNSFDLKSKTAELLEINVDFGKQVQLSEFDIEKYFEMKNEKEPIVDLIFRMNLLILENNKHFSNISDMSNIFNKFFPEAKKEIQFQMREFIMKNKRSKMDEYLSEFWVIKQKKKNLYPIEIKKKQISRLPKYSITSIKKGLANKLMEDDQKSPFLCQNRKKFVNVVSKRDLNLKIQFFLFTRFEDRISEKQANDFFSRLYAKKITNDISVTVKQYYRQKMFNVVEKYIEEETKKRYNKNSTKYSKSVPSNKKEQNTFLDRIRTQISFPESINFYKLIQQNQRRHKRTKENNFRNKAVCAKKSSILSQINRISSRFYFSQVFEKFEDSYIDPIHSIHQISKITFQFSDHFLRKSFFAGLNFELIKESLSLKTIFYTRKYYATEQCVSIRFSIFESPNKIYNDMMMQKLPLFYTILPIFHSYLMQHYFINNLFDKTNFKYKNSVYEFVINSILRKAGYLFSLIFIQLDSRCLASLAGMDIGLHNWMDFCHLHSLISINKFLLVITKVQLRKANGVIPRTEITFDAFSKDRFLKDHILNIFVNQIYTDRILYFFEEKARFHEKRLICNNDGNTKLTICADIQSNLKKNLDNLVNNLIDSLKIQKIARGREFVDKIIVGTKIYKFEETFVQLVYIVKFNYDAILSIRQFCDKMIYKSIEKIEGKLKKKIDDQKVFSIFLIIFTKNIFTFNIKINSLPQTNTEPKKKSKFKMNAKGSKKKEDVVKILRSKKFISCSKMLFFYCFPELIKNPEEKEKMKTCLHNKIHKIDQLLVRLLADPFDTSIYLKMIEKMSLQVNLSNFIYKKASSQNFDSTKYEFDYSLFNEHFSYLSKSLKGLLEGYLSETQHKSSYRIKNMDLLQFLDDFIQTKETNIQTNEVILKYLIPPNKLFSEKNKRLKNKELTIKEDDGGFGEYNAMPRGSLKYSFNKNQFFLENFIKIRKEVELSLQLLNKNKNVNSEALKFIRLSSDSSFDEIKLMIEDPFLESTKMNLNEMYDNKYFIDQTRTAKKIEFNLSHRDDGTFFLNGFSIDNKNQFIQKYFHLEGEDRNWENFAFIFQKDVYKTFLKIHKIDSKVKQKTCNLILSKVDCLAIVEIIINDNYFERDMTISQFIHKHLLHRKNSLNYLKLKNHENISLDKKNFIPAKNNFIQLKKFQNLRFQNSESLLSNLFAVTNFDECMTNLVKMSLASLNNREEILLQDNQTNLLSWKSIEVVDVDQIGKCEIEVRLVVHNLCRIIIAKENDFQTVSSMKILNPSFVYDKPSKSNFVDFKQFIYFRLMVKVKEAKNSFEELVKKTSSMFVTGEHFFFRISLNSLTHKFKKAILILNPIDFAQVMKLWLVFNFKNLRKQQTFIDYLAQFSVKSLYQSIIKFMSSRLVFYQDNLYKSLALCKNGDSSLNPKNLLKNEVSPIDTTQMKNKPAFLKKVNSRTILLSHTIFLFDEIFFVFSFWVHKLKKMIKLRVYNPVNKKFSIFWFPMKVYVHVVNKCLNDFLLLVLSFELPKKSHSNINLETNQKFIQEGFLKLCQYQKSHEVEVNVLEECLPSYIQSKVKIDDLSKMLIIREDSIVKNIAKIESLLESRLIIRLIRILQKKTFNYKILYKKLKKQNPQKKTENVKKWKTNMNYEKKYHKEDAKKCDLRKTSKNNDNALQNYDISIFLILFKTHFVNLFKQKIVFLQSHGDVWLYFSKKVFLFNHCALSYTITSNHIDFDVEILFKETTSHINNDDMLCIRKSNILKSFNLISGINALHFNFEIKIMHSYKKKWNEEMKIVNLKEIMNRFVNEYFLAVSENGVIENVSLFHIEKISHFIIWKMMQAGSGPLCIL